MLLGTEAAILGQKPARDFVFRDALAQLGTQPCHGLVVHGRGGTHEVELMGVLDGARVVHGRRAQAKLAGHVCVHEGQQPTGGEHLVDAERLVVTCGRGNEGDGVLRVIERDDARPRRGGVGEEPVAEHRGLDGTLVIHAREVEAIEALIGHVPVAREVPDGHGIGDEDLPHAELLEVVHDARGAREVERARLGDGSRGVAAGRLRVHSAVPFSRALRASFLHSTIAVRMNAKCGSLPILPRAVWRGWPWRAAG